MPCRLPESNNSGSLCLNIVADILNPDRLKCGFVTVQAVGRASRLSGGRLALALSPGNAGEMPGAAGETPAPLPE